MNFRKFLLFLHLAGGLVAAVFLILLGGSGGLLVFESEIDHWLNARLTWVQPEGARLSLGELSDKVLQRHPASKVTTFLLHADERIATGIVTCTSATDPPKRSEMGVDVTPSSTKTVQGADATIRSTSWADATASGPRWNGTTANDVPHRATGGIASTMKSPDR